jgi:hypothetical protein
LFQALTGAGLAGTYMPGLKALTDRVTGQHLTRTVALLHRQFRHRHQPVPCSGGLAGGCPALADRVRDAGAWPAAGAAAGAAGESPATPGRRSWRPVAKPARGARSPRGQALRARLFGSLLGAVRTSLLACRFHRLCRVGVRFAMSRPQCHRRGGADQPARPARQRARKRGGGTVRCGRTGQEPPIGAAWADDAVGYSVAQAVFGGAAVQREGQ